MTLDLKRLKDISGSTVLTQETQGCSNLSSTKTNRMAANPEAVEHREAQDIDRHRQQAALELGKNA